MRELKEVNFDDFKRYEEKHLLNEHGDVFINLHDMHDKEIYQNDIIIGIHFRSLDGKKALSKRAGNWIPIVGVVSHSILFGAKFDEHSLPLEQRYLSAAHAEKRSVCRSINTSLKPHHDVMVMKTTPTGRIGSSGCEQRINNYLLVAGNIREGILIERENIIAILEQNLTPIFGPMYKL